MHPKITGIAYLLLFEREHEKNPTLTLKQFNTWLRDEIDRKAEHARKAAKG